MLYIYIFINIYVYKFIYIVVKRIIHFIDFSIGVNLYFLYLPFQRFSEGICFAKSSIYSSNNK